MPGTGRKAFHAEAMENDPLYQAYVKSFKGMKVSRNMAEHLRYLLAMALKKTGYLK